VDYGFLLYESAYYNVFEDAIIDARLQCFQIIDGANENIIRGGRCQNALGLKSGTGLWLRNVNDVKVFGTSFENLGIGIDIDSGAVGTSIFSPRFEGMNCGVRINNASRKTSIFHIYTEKISGLNICSTAGAGLPDSKLYLYMGWP
jgi:nitrous oxidase accessory protein NosD